MNCSENLHMYTYVRDALEKNDYTQLADLMKENFSTRRYLIITLAHDIVCILYCNRKIYGDGALGKDNLKMIEIAHKVANLINTLILLLYQSRAWLNFLNFSLN